MLTTVEDARAALRYVACRRVRIERAKRELASGKRTLIEAIAHDVGLSSGMRAPMPLMGARGRRVGEAGLDGLRDRTYEVDHPEAILEREWLAILAGPGGVPVIFDYEGVSAIVGDLAGHSADG